MDTPLVLVFVTPLNIIQHYKLANVNICEFFSLFGTHEVLDHLTSLPSSKKTISQLGIKPPTTPFDLDAFPLSSGSLGPSHTPKELVTLIHHKDKLEDELNDN